MRNYDAYRYGYEPIGRASARWADRRELEKRLIRIDLEEEKYPASGLPLLSDGRVAYVNSDDSHGLIMGSTGSKKSRLLAMPMMEIFARSGESVIVTDPKGELYDRTSGLFAKEGYRIQVINLREPHFSNGWNPMNEAIELYRSGREDAANASLTDFANLVFPQREGSYDHFWEQSSRSLFTGMLLMQLEKPELWNELSLRTARQIVDGINRGAALDTRQIVQTYPASSLARYNMNAMLTGSEGTTSNVLVSFLAGVSFLFADNALLDMLSRQEVDFADIGHHKTALYIIMPDEKTTLHQLVSLCIKQCYVNLIGEAQRCKDHTLPLRVNFLLDEFSNLPPIPDMSSMISAARSRNIRFYLFIQSLHQLKSKYGEDADTIRGNCNDWVYLTSREVEMLQELQTLCGTDYETGKPLISLSQLQRLDKEKGEVLILCGRLYPYMGRLADIDEYPFSGVPALPLPDLDVKPYEPLDSSTVLSRSSNVPQNAYGAESFDEAREKALADKKPVLFRFGHWEGCPMLWHASPLPDKDCPTGLKCLRLISYDCLPYPDSMLYCDCDKIKKSYLPKLTWALFDYEEISLLVPQGKRGLRSPLITLPSFEAIETMLETAEQRVGRLRTGQAISWMYDGGVVDEDGFFDPSPDCEMASRGFRLCVVVANDAVGDDMEEEEVAPLEWLEDDGEDEYDEDYEDEDEEDDEDEDDEDDDDGEEISQEELNRLFDTLYGDRDTFSEDSGEADSGDEDSEEDP